MSEENQIENTPQTTIEDETQVVKDETSEKAEVIAPDVDKYRSDITRMKKALQSRNKEFEELKSQIEAEKKAAALAALSEEERRQHEIQELKSNLASLAAEKEQLASQYELERKASILTAKHGLIHPRHASDVLSKFDPSIEDLNDYVTRVKADPDYSYLFKSNKKETIQVTDVVAPAAPSAAPAQKTESSAEIDIPPMFAKDPEKVKVFKEMWLKHHSRG